MGEYVSFFSKLPRINKIIYFIGLIAIVVGSFGIKLSQDEGLILFFDNIHWTFSTLAAAILSALGYMRNRFSASSKTSLWFFIGFMGYAIGQLAWDIQTFFSYTAFPSPSDLFYIWLGPSISIALFYELSLHKEKINKPTFLLDLLGISIAALTLIFISYLPRGEGIDILSMSVIIAYPITLIIPVIMLLLMIPSMRLRINTSLSIFLIGIAVTAWSWMNWNSMALDGLTTSGSWFNILFSISILISGLSVSNWSLTVSNNKQYDRFSEVGLRILPVITVAISSFSVIIVGSDSLSTSFTKELVYFGAGIVILLAIIRQSHLLYDRESIQKETLDRLTLATTHNGIGIWDWNLKTMEVIWDDSMFKLYHTRREDFSGVMDAWEKSLHPDDKEYSKEETRLALSGEKPYDTEFRVVWPNGEIRYIKAVAKTFFDNNGTPLRMLGTNIDITELRVAKDDIIKKDNLLRSQSRHAAMGEMISMIAHQWRQPLGAISAAIIQMRVKIDLDVLKLKSEDEKYLSKQFHDIDLYVKNLSTTIDDFRNFYKPDKDLETIELEEVCIKSLSIMKASLVNNNINIIEDYCSNNTFEMYSNEMIQVIINILKNSLDNILEKNVKEPYIKISTHNNLLTVCDNGGGIADNIINKIFDPYFSTKDEKNGTGLGLYMSKIIVEEHHNGKLSVSNVNDGACFTVELEITSEL